MAENKPTQCIPEPVQQAFDAVMAFQWPSTDQPFHERINNNAEQESRSTSSLRLDEYGLTSGMLPACIDQVSELRDHFLKLYGTFNTAIHSSLDKIESLQGIDGEIVEKQKEYEQIQASAEKKHEADSKYEDAKKKVTDLEVGYKAMYRDEGQREAKDFSLIAYGALLFGVGAAEWMVNYETFLNFSEVPLMAAGATILVAAAVAFAAHFHGTMLKGHQHFFGDHVETPKKNSHIRWFVIVSIILAVAFGGVGGARYLLVASQVSQLGGGAGGLLGGDVITINVGQVVTVSMVINIFVWFVGAAIAYAVHDENPAFTDKLREYKKAKKIFEPMRKVVDMEIFQLRSKLEKEIKELKNTARAYGQETKPLADLLVTVTEKSNQISTEADRLANRLIRSYRSALTDQAVVGNPELKFNKSGQLIDLDAYRQLAICFSFQNQLGE
ncbi:MAG: hypothetical protein M0Q44_02715 [Methylobacter sp.]|jgi:hypothetical protein|nr:hypothetical protein [Methylobacter sp.]